MLGRLDCGVLDVREIHRFPNEPVRQNGSLQWDILRLWQEMRRRWTNGRRQQPRQPRRRHLGMRLRAARRARRAGREPVSLSRFAHQRRDGGRVASASAATRSMAYRHPVPAVQHALSALRGVPADAGADRRRRALVTIPDLLNYWLTGALTAEYTSGDDHAVRRCADAHLGQGACSRDRLPTRLLQPMVEPGTTIGPLKSDASPACAGTPVIAPACHDTGRRSRRCRRPARRLPQLRHLVAARHRDRGADHHRAGAARSTSPTRAASPARPGCSRNRRHVAAAVLPAALAVARPRRAVQRWSPAPPTNGSHSGRSSIPTIRLPEPDRHAGNDCGVLPDDRPA